VFHDTEVPCARAGPKKKNEISTAACTMAARRNATNRDNTALDGLSDPCSEKRSGDLTSGFSEYPRSIEHVNFAFSM
jgi:hypothetical protein